MYLCNKTYIWQWTIAHIHGFLFHIYIYISEIKFFSYIQSLHNKVFSIHHQFVPLVKASVGSIWFIKSKTNNCYHQFLIFPIQLSWIHPGKYITAVPILFVTCDISITASQAMAIGLFFQRQVAEKIIKTSKLHITGPLWKNPRDCWQVVSLPKGQ